MAGLALMDLTFKNLSLLTNKFLAIFVLLPFLLNNTFNLLSFGTETILTLEEPLSALLETVLPVPLFTLVLAILLNIVLDLLSVLFSLPITDKCGFVSLGLTKTTTF